MGLPNFHHHPDNIIYIRTSEGTYQDTPENFSLDLGENYDSFSGGIVERYYEQNVKHYLASDNTAFPQDLNWEIGNNYISEFNNLMLAKEAREAIEE